jgi:hypothetical protein
MSDLEKFSRVSDVDDGDGGRIFRSSVKSYLDLIGGERRREREEEQGSIL